MADNVRLNILITKENAEHLKEAAEVYGSVTQAVGVALELHKWVTDAAKDGYTLELCRNGWFEEIELEGYHDERPLRSRLLRKAWDAIR